MVHLWEEDGMVAGFSRLIMEFPAGIEMAGYVFRQDPSLGTHDPLEAFCVYLSDGSSEVAILVYDLLGIPEKFPQSLNGVPPIPVATHTHSGPKPSMVFEKIVEYSRELVKRAKKNSENLEKMVIRETTVDGICDYRDRAESTKLPVVLMEFKTTDESFFLLIFRCHPTVLGPENLLYSSDLAGGIRRKLEEKMGGSVVYLNSCCGNISTNRTRTERSFREVERLSEIFVEKLDWKREKEMEPTTIKFREFELKLPIVVKKRVILENDERLKPAVELLKTKRNHEKFERARVSILKIDDLNLVFLPFELFHESCQNFESENTILINYAHSYRSYVVPEGIDGTYEWMVSPYPEGVEKIIFDRVMRELRNIQNHMDAEENVDEIPGC